MTKEERHSVLGLYNVVDMRKFTLVRLPCPVNIDAAVCLCMFLASVKLAIREILAICDDWVKQSLDTPPWVKGWEITLHKCFRKALGSPQIMASPPACLIDDFFVQVRQELGIDETGSSAS